MNNLLSEIDKSFEEKYKASDDDGYMIPDSDGHYLSESAGQSIKSFLHQAVKRAYEEGQEDVRDCVRRNLFSHRNRLCECYKPLSELIQDKNED